MKGESYDIICTYGRIITEVQCMGCDRGKEEKFEELYQQYRNDVYKISLYYTKNEQEAQDITQKVFFALYLRMDKIELQNAREYLLRAARNLSYNWLRDTKKEREGEDAEPEGIAMLDVKMKAFQRYRDNNSVLVCDSENEAVENISQVISGATDVVRQALEFIACINRTPAVKLLGISPSGFNATGESDIRNYYDHIKAKQELYRDQIQKIIDIIQLITYGTIDPSIGFNFNEIGGDDLANNTNIFKIQTDVLNGLFGSGVIDNAEAREFVRTSEIGGLDYISEDVPKPQIDPEDLKAMAGQKGKE